MLNGHFHSHHLGIMKSFLAVLFILFFASGFGLLQAQTPSPTPLPNPNPPSNSGEIETNPSFWQARFNNGGHYLVKLGAISSASKHEYIANATARVVEVTVAAAGAVVARFYYLEPVGKNLNPAVSTAVNAAQSIVQSTANSVAPGVANLQVVKDYPNTTHAHTVEYALQSEAALNSLYDSLLRSIEGGRGRTWVESVK